MGRDELLETLRAQGEARSLAIWRKAEVEVARLQGEKDQTIDQMRRETAAGFESRAAEQARPILLQAEREARGIRCAARRELAERLYRLACENLDRLRDEGYPGLFAALAKELPAQHWSRIQVAPADGDLARSHFPEAEVEIISQLSGGLKGIDQSGRLQVDNSLDKRLERAWPRILPELLQALGPKEQTP